MAKGQTTQWPKDRQHNGQRTLAIVLSVLLPLCCLSFGHCVVCPLAIVFSVLSSYPFSIFKPFFMTFIYLPPLWQIVYFIQLEQPMNIPSEAKVCAPQ
jgi:hypothetical protein